MFSHETESWKVNVEFGPATRNIPPACVIASKKKKCVPLSMNVNNRPSTAVKPSESRNIDYKLAKSMLPAGSTRIATKDHIQNPIIPALMDLKVVYNKPSKYIEGKSPKNVANHTRGMTKKKKKHKALHKKEILSDFDSISKSSSLTSFESRNDSTIGNESGLASEDDLVRLTQTLNLTPLRPGAKEMKSKWERFGVPDLEATCNCGKPIKSDSVQTEEFSKMLVTLLQAANATWDKCPKCLAVVLDYGTSRVNKPLGDFLGFHFARSLDRVNELMPDEVRPFSDLLEALMEQNHFFFRAFIDDSDRFIKFVSLAQSHEESRRAMRDLVYKSVESAESDQLKSLLESNIFAEMNKLIVSRSDISNKYSEFVDRLLYAIPKCFLNVIFESIKIKMRL